jgi:hypothetical protein
MPDRRFKASRFADCRSDDALRRPCEDSEVVGAGFKPAPTVRVAALVDDPSGRVGKAARAAAFPLGPH